MNMKLTFWVMSMFLELKDKLIIMEIATYNNL